jgi:hypothetical protein
MDIYRGKLVSLLLLVIITDLENTLAYYVIHPSL